MALSRTGRTWPGGAESWYIYSGGEGLEIHMPRWNQSYAKLNKVDTTYLRDLLNKALERDYWQEPRVPETLAEKMVTAMADTFGDDGWKGENDYEELASVCASVADER